MSRGSEAVGDLQCWSSQSDLSMADSVSEEHFVKRIYSYMDRFTVLMDVVRMYGVERVEVENGEKWRH